MSKSKLLLIGAGGHARACIDVIEGENRFEIFGLIGLEEELGMEVGVHKVVGTDKDISKFVKDCEYALITVGQIRTASTREKLYAKALDAGFKFPAVISPKAYVSTTARIGNGSIVMHGALINANVKVGRNCIINTRALLEHDSKVLDNSHVSTGAILNGGVLVGENCFVGSGTVIKEGVSIGENSVIGMGAFLRSNLNPNSLFLGE